MVSEQLRYSAEELKEFEGLIQNKLDRERHQLAQLKESISSKAYVGENGAIKSLDDGADSFEKEQLNQLAARSQKFIRQLEGALIRIKNGTYGVCIDSGKLIDKARLRAVPHTMHSIEAKLNKR